MYQKTVADLQKNPKLWLVTGAAGFIGSNLIERLLELGQTVRGLDNFCTGFKENIEAALKDVSADKRKNFTFIEGDIRNREACLNASASVDYILHQAAIGSVPRSIDDPIFTNENNIDGFLHMLVAAKENRVKNFVYAASSSTYGDEPTLPKIESRIGLPLSPYAVTKYVNELYAHVFALNYNMNTIGLRYFNIFGKRQDPKGAYAAVVPIWFAALLQGNAVFINGDGETSRDFCYIENCVQANILAACTKNPEAVNNVYNIAVGERTTLNELYTLLQQQVAAYNPKVLQQKPQYRDFRQGDVRHSLADISLAKKLLGYSPTYSVAQGIAASGSWYASHLL